jgi:hypothetical protein
MGATGGEAAAETGAAPTVQPGAIDEGGSPSRWPLIAGMAVTLAVLVFGVGLLWWRNRDSAYWPA